MTEAPPRVSVCISFYNDAATIGDAVRSVLAQSFEDFELLLIDDGSTDGGAEVVRALGDERVRVIADGVNLGIPTRFNQLNHLARGTYLARMDGDDLCHPRRLERQVAWLDAHPETDLVATGAWVVDERNRVVGARHRGPLPDGRRAVLDHGYLLHPSVTARTGWFRDNPYDPAFPRAEDKELWYRTWRPRSFHRIPEPLLFYREMSHLRPAAYRMGVGSDRRLLKASLGPRRSLPPLARSYLVEALTVAAHAAHLDEPLIRLRTQRVDPEALREPQRIVDDIVAARR